MPLWQNLCPIQSEHNDHKLLLYGILKLSCILYINVIPEQTCLINDYFLFPIKDVQFLRHVERETDCDCDCDCPCNCI